MKEIHLYISDEQTNGLDYVQHFFQLFMTGWLLGVDHFVNIGFSYMVLQVN